MRKKKKLNAFALKYALPERLDLSPEITYQLFMQRRNDIYHQDSAHVPLRRGGRTAATKTPTEPTKRSGASGLYGEREKRSTLTDDLAVRRTSSRSSRSRRRAKGMTRANKAVLVILVLILVIYLGVLGHTLIKTNRERREPAPPAPATIEAEVDDILEDVQAAVPSAPPGITPAEDAERFRELVQSLKRGTETVTQAERQTGRGQLPQAIEALENLLEHSPHRLDAKIMLADLYVQQNDFAKARDLYYDILAISPQIERGRLRLARTLQSLRHHQAAIHIALWILEDDDFQEEPNQIAALSYMALDQVERAVPHFRRQVAINRDNIVAQNNLAVAYSRLGDHRRAVALFRDVLTAEPGNAVTYYNLAVSLAKQDLEDEAVDVLNDAADRFGLTFVSSWLRSKDFDGIRESVAFVRLQRAVDADDDLF